VTRRQVLNQLSHVGKRGQRHHARNDQRLRQSA
jgi:hypothetical protein